MQRATFRVHKQKVEQTDILHFAAHTTDDKMSLICKSLIPGFVKFAKNISVVTRIDVDARQCDW